jgi:hypothetical protein
LEAVGEKKAKAFMGLSGMRESMRYFRLKVEEE